MQTENRARGFSFFTRTAALLATAGLAGCFGFGGGAELRHLANARVVEALEDLTGGPGATARVGDIVIENRWVRAIIATRTDATGPGGHLIDFDARRLPLDPGGDILGALVSWHNFGRVPLPERIEIIDDGGSTGRAVVRVTARDVAYTDYDLRALLAARGGAGVAGLPASIDPTAAVPVEIRIDYILGPEDRGLRIETSYANLGERPLTLAVGDLITIRGPADPFRTGGSGVLGGRPAPGFGPAGAEVGWNRLPWLGWQGERVAYMYQQGTREVDRLRGQTACLELGGRTACAAGVDFGAAAAAIDGALTPEGALLEVPVRGTGIATWRRWLFADADDIAGAALGALEVRGVAPVVVPVTVNDDRGPASGVDVAALAAAESGELLPWLAARTDADGLAEVPLGDGDWTIAVQRRGAENLTKDGLPEQANMLGVVAGAPATPLSFTVARGGRLEAYARDDRSAPVPARVWIMAADGDPDTLHTDTEGRLLATATSRTLAIRPFADASRRPLPERPDGLIATTVLDRLGSAVEALPVIRVLHTDENGLAVLDLPAGDYVALAARGPLYDAAAVRFSITADKTTRVLLDLPRAVDAGGWASFDPDGHVVGSRGDGLPREEVLAAARGAGLDALALTGLQAAADAGGADIDGLWTLAGQTVDFGVGRIALLDLEVPERPVTRKPTPGKGEALTGTPDGDAVSARDAAGNLLTVSDLTKRINERGAAASRLLAQPRGGHAAAWFDRLGLTWDPKAGWADETPPAAVIGEDPLGTLTNRVWERAWTHLQLSSPQATPAAWWSTLLDAFQLWNLGQRAPLVAGSAGPDGWPSLPGLHRTWVQLSAATDVVLDPTDADARAGLLVALAEGRTVASNGPWLDLRVTARLLNESGAVTEVITTLGPTGPGGVLSLNPALFPAGADLALEVSVTTRMQAPVWMPLSRLEIYRSAPANVTVSANDLTGAALLPLAARVRSFSAAEISAATVAATVHMLDAEGAVTTVETGASRIEITDDWTFRLEDAEVRTGQDFWLTVRAAGDVPLWPIVTDPEGLPVRPFAVASPIWLDLKGGGSGVFETDVDGPCEKAGNPACPVTP